MHSLPPADAVPEGEDRERIASQARRKFSGALANDTKWNALIVYIRGLEGWKPSYRSKWVNGHISRWDTEWFYHLPFPFVGVEWFDIGMHGEFQTGRLIAPKIIDHSPEIRSERHAQDHTLAQAVRTDDSEQLDALENQVRSTTPRHWRKSADKPLGEVLARRKSRQDKSEA